MIKIIISVIHANDLLISEARYSFEDETKENHSKRYLLIQILSTRRGYNQRFSLQLAL